MNVTLPAGHSASERKRGVSRFIARCFISFNMTNFTFIIIILRKYVFALCDG